MVYEIEVLQQAHKTTCQNMRALLKSQLEDSTKEHETEKQHLQDQIASKVWISFPA